MRIIRTCLSIYAVSLVNIVSGLRLLAADEVHDLVLALSRDTGVREQHSQALPQRIRCQALADSLAEEERETRHPSSTGCDASAIELLCDKDSSKVRRNYPTFGLKKERKKKRGGKDGSPKNECE